VLHHLEPYLLAPSALTPTALLERAAQLADSAAVRHAVDALAAGAPVRVRHTPLYDAWLLRWEPGHRSDLHAHEGAHGAYAALTGRFRETVAVASALSHRLIDTGERVAFRPGHLHQLAAVGAGPAVSLHLFSPPRPAGPCQPLAPAAVLARPALVSG
jgi:hypothetical protein